MRKPQQGQRHQASQAQSPRGMERGVGMMNGSRANQTSQTYGQSYDQDQDLYEGARAGSRAGLSSSSSYGSDDSYETGRGFRDADYDLDGSTYSSQRSQSPRSMSGRNSESTYGEYETNDRNRQPSRYSSLDEDRYSADRSDRFASDRSDRWSERSDRGGMGMDRQGSSSERFGYPSNMNAWSGSDRSFNSGRTPGRMGQSSWAGSQDQDYSSHAGSQSFGSYGEGSLGNESRNDSQRGFFGKGPKGYKRSDDRIKEEVCETLARNHRIDASDIEVSVEDACVTLSGTIESREARRAAEMAIENLSGVDDVKNEIRVKKADSSSSESSFGASSSQGVKSSKASPTTAGTSSTKGSGHNS